jgi:enoyl-CoA hydratase
MIKLTRKDNFALITIDNPPMNVLCTQLLVEMDSALTEIENSDFRALVITGEGKAFIAGADIKEMSAMGSEKALEFSTQGQKVLDRIENLSIPVIAAVNGFALGGGTEFAMACDIIIASEKAKFGQPEVKLGVIPGFGGTQRLSRIVGARKAKELIFLGNIISSAQALEIGLINRLVAPEELMEVALKMATTISRNAPLAVQSSKALINKGLDTTLAQGQKLEQVAFSQIFKTSDQKEGMRAFVEKEKPQFKGE